ncbi:MAG: hypothetical protein JSW01_01310 [Candidatus Bathyarchaeota archaeon]|nr:MAG: hypothetical protein JSW01_01310 [Candidatus Bathyarchaeota archaeon]
MTREDPPSKIPMQMHLRSPGRWTARFAVVGFIIIVLVFAYQIAYPWVYPFYHGKYADYEITNWIEASGYASLALNIVFDFEEKDYSKLLGMSVEGGQHRFEMRESYWEQGSGQYRNMSIVSWEPTIRGSTERISVTYRVRSYSIRYEMSGWDPLFWIKKYPDEVSKYLTSNSYFPVNDPEIRAVANRVTQGVSDPSEKVRRIYDWVTESIEYEMVPEHYVDTAWIVRNRKAVCEGIALVMSTMLRSIGIPARTVHGAIAIDGESLYYPTNYKHAWVEFYMYSKWIAADPTWGASSENKEHYWAGMRDDIAYPEIGRPLRTTIGVIDDISFIGMGTLTELYTDFGRVKVVGEGFAPPPKETFTRQLWIGTIAVFTMILVGGTVLWGKRKTRHTTLKDKAIIDHQSNAGPAYCKFCGSRLVEGSVFCDQCGRRIR